MAVLEVLPEMIGSIELLRRIAFSKFMHVGQVLDLLFPVARSVGELFTTETTNIDCHVSRIRDCRWMEGGLVRRDGCTRPRLFAKVEGVLVSFGLILVLEPVVAICTRILFLVFVSPTTLLEEL